MTTISNIELTEAVSALHPFDMVALVLAYIEELLPEELEEFDGGDFDNLVAVRSALESIEMNHFDFYT